MVRVSTASRTLLLAAVALAIVLPYTPTIEGSRATRLESIDDQTEAASIGRPILLKSGGRVDSLSAFTLTLLDWHKVISSPLD